MKPNVRTDRCFAPFFRVPGKEMAVVQLKRAGFLTKLVILALLIYMATSLLDLRSQIRETQGLRDSLAQQVSVAKMEHHRLSVAIEGSDDPAVMEQVARDKGYVREDEVLYIDVAN